MHQFERDAVLRGRLSLQRASELIGLTHSDFNAWLGLTGETSDNMKAGLFELYQIDLVRKLVELGYSADKTRQMPIEVQRAIVAERNRRSHQATDWSEMFNAADRLDKRACYEQIANVRAEQGSLVFAIESATSLMQAVGERWWHGKGGAYQEHLLTSTLKAQLCAIMMEQVAQENPELRIIVTTPYGEIHEIGAMVASIAAHEAGHETIFLGPQLPVSEIMHAVDTYGAHIVCLASSFLDRKRLHAQVTQLRAVLPDHVVICLGGRRFEQQQFSSLKAVMAYDDLPSFYQDMLNFRRMLRLWLPGW